jgi:hypothetical protein
MPKCTRLVVVVADCSQTVPGGRLRRPAARSRDRARVDLLLRGGAKRFVLLTSNFKPDGCVARQLVPDPVSPGASCVQAGFVAGRYARYCGEFVFGGWMQP